MKKLYYIFLLALLFPSVAIGQVDESKFDVIDSFLAGDYKVVAMKYHKMEGDFAKRYHFLAQKEKNGRPKAISLGSYPKLNKALQAIGDIKEGEQVFHLDGYDGKRHYTFGFLNSEPSYESVRKEVIKLLSNDDFEKDSQSSQTFTGGVLP